MPNWGGGGGGGLIGHEDQNMCQRKSSLLLTVVATVAARTVELRGPQKTMHSRMFGRCVARLRKIECGKTILFLWAIFYSTHMLNLVGNVG